MAPLVFTTQMSLRESGHKVAANIVSNITKYPKENLNAALEVLKNGPKILKKYTLEEAAILIAC